MFRAENYLDNSAYENLRPALAPELRTLSNAQLEALFAEADIDVGELDEFLGGFGKSLASIGGQVAKALPGVAQAALPIVGTAFGGPLGGMLGGMAGQAIGGFAKGQSPRQVAAGAVGQLGGMAGQMLGGRGGAAGAAGAAIQHLTGAGAKMIATGRAPAASQLLQLFGDPRILQGLAGAALGPAGARGIPIGGQRIPPAAITNLIGQLAQQATLEAFAQESGSAELSDYAEAYDSASATERAGALLELLNETYPEIAETPERYAPRTFAPTRGHYEAYYEAYFDAFDSSGDSDSDFEGEFESEFEAEAAP
jgi:hypothetical protein